jgi:hypothetical protein
MKEEYWGKSPKNKPRAMLLKINENDVKKNEMKINFLPVKFDIGPCI